MKPHTSVMGHHVKGRFTDENMAEGEAAWDAMMRGEEKEEEGEEVPLQESKAPDAAAPKARVASSCR